MASPEVRRGDFIYRDTLFVDLGDNKRHPRAPLSDLKDLLMPKGAAPKDQVAHWYEAQLVHYGLPRTKDKNTAKVRLTGAISGKTLKVPEYVVQMENDMKKEYASAMKRAANTTKKAAALKAIPIPASGRKRKAHEPASNSARKLIIKDGDFSVEYDRSTGTMSETPAKKSKTTQRESKKEKTDPRESKRATPKAKPATKPASTETKKTTTSTRPASASSPVQPRSDRPKQTARRSKPFHYPSTSTRPSNSSPQRTYTHTPHSFTHNTSDEEDDPPPAYNDIYNDYDDYDDRPASPLTTTLQISGTYSLHISTPSSPPSLPELYLSSSITIRNLSGAALISVRNQA